MTLPDPALVALRRSFLFGRLSDAELAAIGAAVTTERFAAGATILREGEAGESCYLVTAGEAAVVTRDLIGEEVVLQTFAPGASFGAVALTTGGPRTATVRALTDLEVLTLSRAAFDRIRSIVPAFDAHLRSYVDFLDIDRFLRKASPFARLPIESLRRIVPLLESVRAEPGQVLVRQGETGDRFYLVRSGRLDVIRDGARRQQLAAGDCFGEVALLTGGPRVASVVATEPAELLALSKADFDAVAAEHGQILGQLSELARIRYRGARGQALATPDPVTTLMPFIAAKQRDRYWKILAVGIAAFAALSVLAARTGSELAMYGALVAGAFVVPIVYVTYLAEADILAARPFTLGMTFVLGAALGLPVAIWLEGATGAGAGELLPAFLVGLIEELAKVLGVLWLIRRASARFQMDGVVFGAAAGMGFAAFETILFGAARLEDVGRLLATLWMRTLLAPLGHGTWTAIVCATIWRGKGAARPDVAAVARAFAVSVGLHTLWDWAPLPGLLDLVWFLALGATGIVLLRTIVQRATAEELTSALALNPELAGSTADRVSVSCATCGQPALPGSHYCVRCGAALRAR